MVASLRALIRLLRIIGWVMWGMVVVHLRFGRWAPQRRYSEIQRWSQRMLKAMGVQLRVVGEPASGGPLLVVANHVSWLDILVLNAARPAQFVSKSDVKRWPLLGGLVAGAGTLFIERESRRDAMRVVHHMAQALQAGGVVAVFPEGTTGDGRALLPFHANLFQPAISTGSPVQPVGVAYCHPATGLLSDAPVYVGDTTLLQSIWRTLTAPGGVVAWAVHGELQPVEGRDRRQLAQEVSNLIHNRLLVQTRAGAFSS
jgi:1-acyl-sn-glycerol-3-phosphate acyltransferase